jgi:hypothetical protein
MRVETRRSVLEQQGIRVPAFGGKNREGAAPDFQVHMPPSGVIAGKFHNAPRIPLARRRAERCVTRNGLHETNCSRRLPLDHQAEFRVGSTSTVGRNKRHVRTSADRCRMRHCGAGVGSGLIDLVSAHLRDRLHGWAYRIRTLMCRENIHLFEKSQRFGFAQVCADRRILPGE